MKRILILCLALCLALSLVGCGNTPQGSQTEETPQENLTSTPSPDPSSEGTESESTPTMESTEPESGDGENGNVLIAYFSWADNAESYNLEEIGVDALGHASVVAPGDVGRLAEYIEEATGADVFKITITEKYSSNYNECLDQAREQLNNEDYPELSALIENLEEYDVIILGFPNWWYTIPVAVNSFVDAHDLSGKTIIPFVSHGTGGLAGTIRDLTAILPEDCTVLQSYDVYEDDIPDAQDEVNAWLDELGY